jgi:alkylhydroperoxidase/carboxymuconolactone decarboxylase family protein YurZ
MPEPAPVTKSRLPASESLRDMRTGSDVIGRPRIVSDKDRVEGLKRRLASVKAKRGYLLPHHGLLAVTSERLLEAYDNAYTAIALDEKVLSKRDRELVWLAVLIATDEAIATHHIPKFLDAGGTRGDFIAVLALTSLLEGATCYDFVAEHWERHVEALDTDAEYARAVERIAAPGCAPARSMPRAPTSGSCGSPSSTPIAPVLRKTISRRRFPS